MGDLIVILAIVVWVIGTVGKVVRAGKRASPPPPAVTSGPPRARRLTPPPTGPSPAGFANRGQLARNSDQSRAMEGAAPRLAQGAEYGPIVAERAADRAADLRSALGVDSLIGVLSTRATDLSSGRAIPTQPSQIRSQLERLGDNKTVLINAVILAEAIGPPLCMKGPRRQLRT